MILLLSGEGATDIGQSARGGSCLGKEFQPGPMARLVEQLLESCLGYAILDHARQHDEVMLYFVDKSDLGRRARTLKNPKSQFLTGLESRTGTLFHRKSAYALALWAKEIEKEKNETVLAVFFRDSDGTQRCPRTNWHDKRDSIIQRFKQAEFNRGVPMIPKPKSEAWLLCALRHNYQHCESLEDESGNDNSPNNLKRQLEYHLGCQATREYLNELIVNGRIIARQIKMPSFEVFIKSLMQAAQHSGLDVSSLT